MVITIQYKSLSKLFYCLQQTIPLTHSLPVYEYIVLGSREKTWIFRQTYQLHSSSADCIRELFDPWKDSASLRVRNVKKFWFRFRIFSEWHNKWGRFLAILAHVTWPRAQPLERSTLLKFSLETRLESEFFESLINFPVFLVQKLWSKINKLLI